jgi:hypothetical protein
MTTPSHQVDLGACKSCGRPWRQMAWTDPLGKTTLFQLAHRPDCPEVAADESEPVAHCPACGDPIDYCQGHGEIGDPEGRRILTQHDLGFHSECHPLGCIWPQ